MTRSGLKSLRGQRIIIAEHRLELCHRQIATFDRGAPSLWSIGIAHKTLNSSIFKPCKVSLSGSRRALRAGQD